MLLWLPFICNPSNPPSQGPGGESLGTRSLAVRGLAHVGNCLQDREKVEERILRHHERLYRR